MGAQVAESLAAKGHPVTIVEATGSVATEAPIDERALLLERLHKLGVKTLTETKVFEYRTKIRVRCRKAGDKKYHRPYGRHLPRSILE